MVVCIGEILADLIGRTNAEGEFVYARHAGGAPFNVACGVKSMGGRSGFIGRVGDDVIGRFLYDYSQKKQFDFLRLEVDTARNTTLAFVDIGDNGERNFCFARKQTADYCIEDSFEESLSRADIVHIGSLMLSEKEGRNVCDRAFGAAEKLGKRTSFDVNFRSDLFGNGKYSVNLFLSYIRRADIVKVSEDELLFLSGLNAAEGKNWFCTPISRLCDRADKIVVLTLGEKGCAVCFGGKVYTIQTIKAKPVDTTGAGDAFYAAFLAGIDGKSLCAEAIIEAAKIANVAAGYTTEQYGAIVVLPPVQAMAKRAKELGWAEISL